MSTETVIVKFRSDGSRVVKRDIEEIGTASLKSSSALDFLKKALGALASVLVADRILEYADAWLVATGRIRIATKNTEEAAFATEKLFKIAQNTRQKFSGIVELYQRTARSGKELGASQNEVLTSTENVAKILAFTGTSGKQAAGPLLQLGQAFGSGIVRAQEFNSVLEGIPEILRIVANNIPQAEGSVAKLRKILLEGKLTSKLFFDALLKGTNEINENFKKSSFTFNQGFNVIENAFIKFAGELDKSIGGSTVFASIVKFLSENMKLVAATAIGVGTAIAVAFAPRAIIAFTTSIRSLFVLMAANPFGAFIAILAGVIATLSIMKDEIKLGVDDVTTLGDFFNVLFEDIKSGFAALPGIIKSAFDFMSEISDETHQSVKNDALEAKDDWVKATTDYFGGLEFSLFGAVKLIARFVDTTAQLFTILGLAIYRTIIGIPSAISESFKRMYNFILDITESLVNSVRSAVNLLRESIGADLVEMVSFERVNVDKTYFERYGDNIASSITDGVQNQGAFLETYLNELGQKAQKSAQERLKNKDKGTYNPNDALGSYEDPISKKKPGKELEKLKSNLSSLISTIAPIEDAKRDLAKAEVTLTEALQKGLITSADHVKFLQLTREHYEDLINPINKVNKQIDENYRLSQLSTRERDIETEVLKTVQDAKSQGLVLDEKQIKALRTKLQLIQSEKEILEGKDNSLTPIQKAEKELSDSQKILSDAFTRGVINGTEYKLALDNLELKYKDVLNPLSKYNQNLDEQIKLSKLSSKEKEIESQIIQFQAELKEQGINLTDVEINQLRQKLTLLQQTNEATELKNSLLQASNEREMFSKKVTAISDLKNNQDSGFTNTDAQGQVQGILGEMGLDTTNFQGQIELKLGLIQQYYDQLDLLREKDLISEKDYALAKVQLAQRENDLKYQSAENMLGALASLQGSNIRALAIVGKSAAITQSIINTYQAATKALAEGGPISGPIMAAIVTAQGFAQVAAIRSQPLPGFMTGGSFMVGGSGGPDSQTVAFRATPGERVSISTPQQVQKGDPNNQSGSGVNEPFVVKVVNLLDPSVVPQFLTSDEGERIIMNIVRRNERNS